MYQLEPDNRNAPDEEILSDLRNVASELDGRPLTRSRYKELGGRFGGTTVVRRFGSWTSALKVAGLPVSRHLNVSREDLIADMEAVSKRLRRHDLPVSDYYKHGKFSDKTVERHFPSWADALDAAGLESPAAYHPRIENEEYFSDIETVWCKVGRHPRCSDLRAHGRYSLGAYQNRFGGWRKALEAFVDAVSQEQLPIAPQRTPQSPTPTQARPLETMQDRRSPRNVNWRLRYIVMRRDRFRCLLCGASPANDLGVRLVIDHVVPWSCGGETDSNNLRTLCEPCNGGRSNLE